jgi:tetratricopeptide (TPR) repeat protein
MYLIAFFLNLLFGVSIALAQNPITLAEIDTQHEKSQFRTDYQDIALQIGKVLAGNSNQYQWQWRQARTQYFLAKNTGEAKSNHYDLCILHSSRAIELQPNSSISYFYRGLCRGKQGEINGVWASLGIIEPFEKDMKKALELDQTVNNAGPHRALGKLYLELPFFLGGNSNKAIFHLEEAVRLAPDYAENHLGLAQVFIKINNSNQARESLHKLIKLTDNTQNGKLLSLRKEGFELLANLLH